MLSSTHQFMNKTGSGENRAKAPEDSQNQLESTLAWPVLRTKGEKEMNRPMTKLSLIVPAIAMAVLTDIFNPGGGGGNCGPRTSR